MQTPVIHQPLGSILAKLANMMMSMLSLSLGGSEPYGEFVQTPLLRIDHPQNVGRWLHTLNAAAFHISLLIFI